MRKKIFDWAVVGAGPAGIAALGKLLDSGTSAANILWIDPHFKVGDLGLYWRNVSSNTKVKYFNSFLQDVSSFAYQAVKNKFPLHQLNPDLTCALSVVAEPLEWISKQLAQTVHSERTAIKTMFLADRVWHLVDDSKTFKAKNVILATGAVPSRLNYPEVEVIPFEIAIDKDKLAQHIDLKETYAVFGSSHSAMIIVRHLCDLGVNKVINFYRSPCRYAVEMDDWILFDNTGLKGETASWARENIDGTLPPNLFRCNTDEPNITRYLPDCNKVVYAVGFQRRNSIVIGDYEDATYNPHVGIIGPGLFGLGIAYPELKRDPFGSQESQVGLWKFMIYLNKVMPVWFKYPA